MYLHLQLKSLELCEYNGEKQSRHITWLETHVGDTCTYANYGRQFHVGTPTYVIKGANTQKFYTSSDKPTQFPGFTQNSVTSMQMIASQSHGVVGYLKWWRKVRTCLACDSES